MAKRRALAEHEPNPLRPGAKWLARKTRGREVTLGGSGILIYDAANRPALEQTMLGDLGEQVFADPNALQTLEKDDRVWVFTVSLQERDGPFHAQWWVGPPPGAEDVDRSRRPHNPPQSKRLSLPSGRVHVEANLFEFSFGPNASRDEGIEIRIPPGIYDVSLSQAPLPNKDLSRVYFLLAFTLVSDAGKTSQAPRRKAADPRSTRELDEKERMKRYKKGHADSLAGKPRQFTDLYYRRGWSAGARDRKLYERGLADGRAGKPQVYRIQKAYRRGWREGNRGRLADE